MKLSDQFIKANDEICDFGHLVPAPCFRKSFILEGIVQKAQLTICGLGFYELYINGKDITKGLMAPYISNTEDLCYYDSYDLSGLLHEGENVIGVILGNGFRNAYGGFIWDFQKSTQRGPVTLALCLEASYVGADGEEHSLELEADETFKTHPSPILYNDERLGYCYDARKEMPGWNEADFDDSSWAPALRERTPKGLPRLCKAEPIVTAAERKAVSIRHFEELPYLYQGTASGSAPDEETIRKNVYLYDFGVNTAGLTRLKINGKEGQKITIRHGEMLMDGKFTMSNIGFFGRDEEINRRYREYNQTDVFICKGGEETFLPMFKYDGFRYAYVEGLEEDQATQDAVVMLEMHSDLKERGSFSCSDETLNKLQECTRRSDLANFFYFPTDCPHREKNGWTGDASMSSEHILLNLTVENSLAVWLESIRMAQNPQGALPGIVPTGGWGFAWGNGPTWDSVCVNLPYYIYKYTGNQTVIEENVSTIMRYLCYVYGRRDELGLIAIGLGDWVDPNESKAGHIASPLRVTDSIMVHDIAKKAAFLFAQIGKTEESSYAQSIAEGMKRAVREQLIDWDTMTVEGDCQTSQAFALETGIFEEEERETAGKRLLEIVHRDGDINACGMIGLRYLFHALSSLGESELAYRIITSKHRNCYGYWLEHDATALWENFTEESEGQASKNHHFLGDISSWFIQEIAGLKPNPGADDITYFEVSPGLLPQLTYAQAHFDSKQGRLEVCWERKDGKIAIEITVPEGMHGKLILKDIGICEELTAGRYEKEIR